MVKFYVSKIKGKIINPNTGNIWCLEDVPKLWRTQVQNELA